MYGTVVLFSCGVVSSDPVLTMSIPFVFFNLKVSHFPETKLPHAVRMIK